MSRRVDESKPMDPRLADLPERLRAKFATNPPTWWTDTLPEGNK